MHQWVAPIDEVMREILPPRLFRAQGLEVDNGRRFSRTKTQEGVAYVLQVTPYDIRTIFGGPFQCASPAANLFDHIRSYLLPQVEAFCSLPKAL